MEMYPYYFAYICILLASSLIGILLMIRIWGLRSTPGAYALFLSVGCVTEWSLTYAMEIAQGNLAEKIFWAKLEYFGISFVVLGIFIFAMRYSGRSHWLTPIRIILLAAIFSTGFIAALTNEWHSQLWSKIEFTNNLRFGPLNLTHGLFFYIHTGFLYILIIAVTIIFFQIAMHGQSLYRNQSRIMLSGMVFPWIANVLYITGWAPFPALDLTPIALTLTTVALSIGFLRYRMMDIQPVAHASVFNAMADGVIVLDHKERIVDINPAGTFIFQNTGSLLGYDIQTILPKWNEWRESDLQKEINEEIPIEVAGDALTFRLRTTSVFDRRDKRTGRVLLISDTTEQKHAHEQMAEASRMKSQLLAHFGHDLRSPLGAIIGYADMLQDGSFGPMSDNQVKASSEILDAANQLLSFINNLVVQAQFETGKIVLREYPFDVIEVIGPLLSTLNYHAQKKGLALVEDIDPSLPQRLVGDQFWLRQIVMNLVHNAVKFTAAGSVTVRFFKYREDHWVIQVKDTGVGIPLESQKRVFEAFEQVNSMETSQQSGFGLGLSIVAKLTSIMNGRIELISEAGKGSTFTITLPLKEPIENRIPTQV
jgi:signal transduction histidine kinase